MRKRLLPCLGICLTLFSSLLAEELLPNGSFGSSSMIQLAQDEALLLATEWDKVSLKVTKPFAKRDKKAPLHGHVHEPALKWNWGLRNGVKYNRIEEEWLIAGTYTHFHSKSFASLESQGELTPIFHKAHSSKAKEVGSSEASKWRLDVEIGDVEVGKSYQIRNVLSLRPHVGMRAAWMNQKFDIRYDQFERGVLKEPSLWNNSLGLGGRAGVDSCLLLGSGFSFFADGALSLLKSYHNIHENDLDRNLGIAIIESSLGIRYEKSFMNSLCLLSMKAGYEFNHFFNQKRWVNWFSPLAQTMSRERISFQGFSAGFRLDF